MNKENVKLSHAMREGAKLRPQYYAGGWFDSGFKKSCALGAALEYVYGLDHLKTSGVFSVTRSLGIPSKTIINHPITGSDELLTSTITKLNDESKWTREQIADWLESIGY